MSYGSIQKQIHAAQLTNDIGQHKHVYVALFSYAKDHDGLYPTDSESESPTAVVCFTQLIQAGVMETEECFWSKDNAEVLGSANVFPPYNNKIKLVKKVMK